MASGRWYRFIEFKESGLKRILVYTKRPARVYLLDADNLRLWKEGKKYSGDGGDFEKCAGGVFGKVLRFKVPYDSHWYIVCQSTVDPYSEDELNRIQFRCEKVYTAWKDLKRAFSSPIANPTPAQPLEVKAKPLEGTEAYMLAQGACGTRAQGSNAQGSKAQGCFASK